MQLRILFLVFNLLFVQRLGYQPTNRLVTGLAGVSTVPAEVGDENQKSGSKSRRNGGETIHNAERSRYSRKKNEKECAKQLD